MSKAETIRRLLVGDLRRLYRHRCGATLPDDDAGREYLELLLRLISLLPRAAKEKMQFQIETLAPWMPESEATDLINNLLRLDLRFRRLTGKEAGERIQLTNAERELLKAWRIAPVDMSDADLAQQRKVKDRARKRRKRTKTGAVSRQAYLAKATMQRRPWEDAGMSRATWYRHMRQVRPRQDLTTSGTTCLTTLRASSGEPVSASETIRRLMDKRKGPIDHHPQVQRTDLSQGEGERRAVNHGALPCAVRRISRQCDHQLCRTAKV
jgi:hypothetical protein